MSINNTSHQKPDFEEHYSMAGRNPEELRQRIEQLRIKNPNLFFHYQAGRRRIVGYRKGSVILEHESIEKD